ncbi:UDP-4-amino-4-deoxy-L-arabinose--oxoglutarate aminotransferase [compost metagenome]
MAASIPYGRQHIVEADVQAVIDVLNSDWLTQGPAIERFERDVAAYVGAEHAVALTSATAALHLACRALGLGPGDVLWTSPNTFVASANCGYYCGAEVDFVDIDPLTLNMSVQALSDKLARAERSGRLPKVVVPVHFSGEPCDMAAIHALAKRYGFFVIEDASHAIGARYRDTSIGACRYSDITVFSFHPVKLITTGEGGMVLTNRSELAERVRLLRSHGITRDSALMEGESEGPWYYQQIDLGYNYRMTDIQAILGVSQLKRLPEFLLRRQELAMRYDAALEGLPLVRPFRDPANFSALHLYTIRLDSTRVSRTRRDVFEDLRRAGIGVNVHYIPVHLQPFYRAKGFMPGDFPEAERYYLETISLPLFYDLSDQDQDRVVQALGSALEPLRAGDGGRV